MILDAIAVLLLLLPPIDWAVALLLVNVSHSHPNVVTLRERALAAVICAVAATAAGLLAWVRLGAFALPTGGALALIAFVLILSSVPSLYWGWLLVSGRFNGAEK